MSNTSPLITKKSVGFASLAAFGACAACCALPLIAAAGVGGGVFSAVAWFIRPGMDIALAVGVGAAVLGGMAFRARSKAAAGDTICEVGGGCGCAPAANNQLLTTLEPRADAPIVCTADLRDQPTVQAQLDGYRAAFRHLLRTEKLDNGVRWVFANRPGLDAELRHLAAKEHQCCSFFKFDLRIESETIVWETRANPGAATVLAEYARLPERLAQHPRGAEALAIKNAIGDAGLLFASDNVTSK